MICPSCQHDNEAGRKFCDECGAGLARLCATCGTPNRAGARFCGECGAALDAGSPAAVTVPRPAAPAPQPTERRLVSILFADLVGFTPLSEKRDPEAVRELQSRYFDTCRRLIEVYGGVVEKFIGDAVMAVWGSPVATEDDAERAVRAALDLVAAVSALGDEAGVEELRARAGVLTGEAAVTVGAEAEGMIAGDIVNTASRIQAAAAPGQVFVGESTRRAAEPTITFESAGAFELKGKDGLHQLWRALRVVSGARGALKAEGLEAPFVGRDRELRQIKDTFHVCANERRAHLVSVTGIAGIGKSRLVWEFYKYFDGLPQITYWHRGRCLSYGEGVTYWALADMVRMRCRIAEDEPAESAGEKLREVLDEHVTDPGERAFVEPRARHLLGLEEDTRYERDDLFAAWRLFFERLADHYPTVLAFEDMQWADAALLDFIEYLLDWSRQSPLYVVTHARPELVERRPTWGAGKRNFISIYLEPLGNDAMRELLGGLVPGLPSALRDRILERAEGVPLYAVETVRMLLDRGHLVREGNVYRPAGEVETLEVPETLQALIAARLDGLTGDERRVVQVGSVLGKTFTMQALATLMGGSGIDVQPVLDGLVRKEVLSIQSDPRSPEHGQYGFLQDLVRHVAYDTLSKRERRGLHLAAAAYLEQSAADPDELAEVLAAHYLSAYSDAPDTDDAESVRRKAGDLLERAGARARALGAPAEAQRYFEQAADLAEHDDRRAELLYRAGDAAVLMAANEDAARLLTRAIDLSEQLGDARLIARASIQMSFADQNVGHMSRALERLERARVALERYEPDETYADLMTRYAQTLFFEGQLERANELNERGLDVAEALNLPTMLAHGWLTKSLLINPTRPQEGRALLQMALETAIEADLPDVRSRAAGNLSDLCFQVDRYEDSLRYLEQSLADARISGFRSGEWFSLSEMTFAMWMLGRWDDAIQIFAQIPEDRLSTGGVLLSPLNSILEIRLSRGDLDGARHLIDVFERLAVSTDVQEQAGYKSAQAAVALAEGRYTVALDAAQQVFELRSVMGPRAQAVKLGWVYAVEAALRIGDRGRAQELVALVDELPVGLRPPFLDAHLQLFRARLGPPEEAEQLIASAESRFRELGLPYWLARSLQQRAELCAAIGDADRGGRHLDEAAEILVRLGVTEHAPDRVTASGLG